jgi:hypothetical protein
LLVEIERIDDDRAHDERARTAVRRIHTPLAGCSDSLGRFAEAIDSNPAASDKFERAAERLERTLSILLGDELARSHSARDWARAVSR